MSLKKLERIASKVKDYVDLHKFTKTPALKLVQLSLKQVKIYRPREREFNIITGQGKHSQDKEPVIKPLVIEWLKHLRIEHEVDPFNPGVLIVEMKSINVYKL